MFKILIAPEIKKVCPRLELGFIQADVQVGPAASEFLELLRETEQKINTSIQIEEISSLGVNVDTRHAYRKLGKKPGRYRPSAEALLRRIVSGKGLYQVNNVVDLLNLISVNSRFSIGGYDKDDLTGSIRLEIGKKEPYDAIARGVLNIEKLPVLYDHQGPFGSPTSDSDRTKITKNTKKILWVFFNFGGDTSLEEWLVTSKDLLEKFCSGKMVQFWIQ
jgi:DNA/RNA-binding domain of Phe-tRNA-synthetase-like protein